MMSIPRSFYIEVSLDVTYLFYQIQGFPQLFQLRLVMLWKREPTRIWGDNFDRKSFTIIREVKWDNTIWASSKWMKIDGIYHSQW